MLKLEEYFKNNVNNELSNYHELKNFLGQKRKETNQQKLIKDDKYFKQDIENYSINKDENEDIKLKIKDKKKIELITLYNKPLAITEIYDQNTINLSLINDNKTFFKKYSCLNEYDFEIYYLNEDSEIICRKKIDIKDLVRPIKIENEMIRPYLVIMKSKIPIIEDSDLELKNIYPEKEENKDGKIYPDNISKIYFYYFNIKPELQNKYIYIKSNNRISLFKILCSFISDISQKIIIICGAKGIGKTTSLIKFSFINYYNIFYFNLEIFNKYKNDDNQIKELTIQVTKLFGDYIDLDEKNIKNEILEYIKSNRNKNCFEFLYNIINIFSKFLNDLDIDDNPFCFIIEQYSLNLESNAKFDIQKIMKLFFESKKIKLIICPTINNIFAKEQLNYLFSKSIQEQSKELSIYYFQEFISREEMLSDILNNEKLEYTNFMEEAGYIPKIFYDSKYIDIYAYKNYLKQNLKQNLNEYIIDNNNNKDENQVLELLDIIKSERLICSKEFKDKISKLPLKYLKIIKYKIDKNCFTEYLNKINSDKDENILLKYLELLFNELDIKKYDDIINLRFQMEEEDIKLFLDNYLERDESSINIYGNYYEKFIKENSRNISLKLNKGIIYVYQLKFSMLLFEDILYEYIYDNIKKEYNFFKNLLDKGANGGFFEILVDYYIKSRRDFIVNNIKQIFYIPSIVPQKYSINYYSSKRKKEKFVEFNLTEKKDNKKEIPFSNTYIKQTIFNSKYYDMALLIAKNNSLNKKQFNLATIQASIKKEPGKRLSKEEHELILSKVKQNIENEYDIEIDEAYFIYVLSQKNKKIIDESAKNIVIKME